MKDILRNAMTWPRAAVLMVLLSAFANAHAGIYTNELSKCLVAGTTDEQRAALVRWMFIAASAHPAVADIANVSDGQRDASNKAMGELFAKLLTQTCRAEAREATQYEGQTSIENSFEVLGNIAGRELFSDPRVVEGLSGLDEHIDPQAISEALSNE